MFLFVQLYKPVKTVRPEQLLELGCIVTEMGERELQAANLSDLAVVAKFGSFKEWSVKKVSWADVHIQSDVRVLYSPQSHGISCHVFDM